MVLDAVRKAILPDTSLDDVINTISNHKNVMFNSLEGVAQKIKYDKKALLTVCITGEGAARKLKGLLEKMIPDITKKVDIIPVGVIGDEDISTKIDKIKVEKNVAVIVGTVDPNDPYIPFVSMEEIVSGTAVDRIKQILDLNINVKTMHDKNAAMLPLADVIFEDLILICPDFNTKDEVLDGLAQLLIKGNYVNEKFLLDVYKREIIGPTILKNYVAIPHGNSENVIRPAISMAILKNNVEWYAERNANIVFMLALKENSNKIFAGLHDLIKNPDFLNKLRHLKTTFEIKRAFLENLIDIKTNSDG